MKSILTLLIFSIMLTLNTDAVQAQARSGLGINAGLNTSEYGMGYVGMFFGEIKVAKAVSVVPALGYVIPSGLNLSLNGRYFFDESLYVNAGPLWNLASLEHGDFGLGGSAGVGLSQRLSRISVVDFNFQVDLAHFNNALRPVVGVRVAFQGIF